MPPATSRFSSLGRAMGTTPLKTRRRPMIAYYESHAEKAPARHLAALAQVLRVSVDELVGYRPVDTPAGRAIPGCGIGCARSRPCRPRTASRSSTSLTPSSSVRPSRSGRPGAARRKAGPAGGSRQALRRIGSVGSAARGGTQQADSYKNIRAR
jgi:hypothetical protein